MMRGATKRPSAPLSFHNIHSPLLPLHSGRISQIHLSFANPIFLIIQHSPEVAILSFIILCSFCRPHSHQSLFSGELSGFTEMRQTFIPPPPPVPSSVYFCVQHQFSDSLEQQPGLLSVQAASVCLSLGQSRENDSCILQAQRRERGGNPVYSRLFSPVQRPTKHAVPGGAYFLPPGLAHQGPCGPPSTPALIGRPQPHLPSTAIWVWHRPVSTQQGTPASK